MISRREKRKFDSGPKLSPEAIGHRDQEDAPKVGDYDAISIGFPAPVRDGRIMKDPKHLAQGLDRLEFQQVVR